MNLTYKKSESDLLLILMIIAIGLENFKLFNLLGAPIKVTHVLFLLAILISLVLRIVKQKFNMKHTIALMFLLVIPLLPLYRIGNITEFFKTYLIYIIMLFFIVFSYSVYLNKFHRNYMKYIYLFLWMILIIQVLGIVQFICMNYFGYFFLRGIWGNFQFHTSIYGMQFGLYRAYSIFHEPSLFGWMTTTSFAICLYLNRKGYLKSSKFYFFQFFNIIAVGVSVSASSLSILLLIYVVSIFLESKKPVKFIVLTIISCAVFGLLWKFTNVFASLDRISNEINTSGTSGYERFNSPWRYVVSTFDNYPLLGRGLGQEGNVDAVGIIGLYEGVNNSIYGIFVNLGSFAIIYILFLISYFIRKLKNNRDYLLLIVAVFGIYISTGAYLSLDTFVVLIFVLFVGDLPQNKQSISINRGSQNETTCNMYNYNI